ncbi:hypothetical protein EDI_180220 [Entamoeba dispar SAW760]|uniref:Uncharacterized protein n=1 Tax=Entamoeba dispar (strain ATCC PRA-260 / SAW760) TaxID=370354 RepID=B0E914_ENTDS|nr:uncharacterized protein EDI_180220 [Entamoeba dispar SAW760]EDR28987.1 hypothetical protein EDI_180220 [Entamoeba dispar SAW760]|eukprot:EDR28987.1 hypothetical protein EDI_180220 [Entamoeba dispar SAW760]
MQTSNFNTYEKKFEDQYHCTCCLCKRVVLLRNGLKKIKTTDLCILILKSLKELKPEKEFYSMKQDIYEFVTEHWNCVKDFSVFTKPHWKKILLDTFNHCTNIETGKNFKLRASFRIRSKTANDNKSESSESGAKTVVSSVELSPSVQSQTSLIEIDTTQYIQTLLQLQSLLYNDAALLKKYYRLLGEKNPSERWRVQYNTLSRRAFNFGVYAQSVHYFH